MNKPESEIELKIVPLGELTPEHWKLFHECHNTDEGERTNSRYAFLISLKTTNGEPNGVSFQEAQSFQEMMREAYENSKMCAKPTK